MSGRYRTIGFVATAVGSLAAYAAVLSAQTSQPHPITSLPKPPSSSSATSPQPSPSATPPASNATPTTMPAPRDAGISPVDQPRYSPPSASSSTTTSQVASPNLGPPPLHASTNEDRTLLVDTPKIRPFSAIGFQIKAGFGGVGIDIATPLAQHFNLRAGGSFFSYTASYNVDGMTLSGQADFRSANVCLDWYLFHGGFRISPGVTLYNGNGLTGTLSVPGGQKFDLGDGDYTSSSTDPVHGIGSMSLGRRTAPSFTLGWGNMIPRSGRRFSMPVEIGFQYIGPPKINFTLMGTACNQGCNNIATDPTSQANLQQELTDINNKIAPLRFYPIISIGIAWAFGSHTARTD